MTLISPLNVIFGCATFSRGMFRVLGALSKQSLRAPSVEFGGICTVLKHTTDNRFHKDVTYSPSYTHVANHHEHQTLACHTANSKVRGTVRTKKVSMLLNTATTSSGGKFLLISCGSTGYKNTKHFSQGEWQENKPNF